MMLAKISSDMPLPMPRWVMSSPIHMMNAVPAISVMTMTTRGEQSKLTPRPARERFWNTASSRATRTSAMPSVR